MNSILYIGMDVHKKTYNLCCYNGETGDISNEVKIAADVNLVVKYLENLKKKFGNDVKFQCGYEAGCLGYVPYLKLKDRGIDCVILAPTTMAYSAKNKKNKNDKLDARNIAINMANGTYKAVYVINEDDAAVKEYIRMVDDFKVERKKVKQHINAFTLRQGHKYPGKSNWTQSHIKWLNNLPLKGLNKEILSDYLAEYDALCDKIERFEDKLVEISLDVRYEEPVSKLRCFKGIDTATAISIHVEISDFNRFSSAKAFANYVGLTPGQRSSSENINYLPITKQGNSTVRKLLIESAQALVKGKPGQKSKRVKARQKGQNTDVIAYADRGTERLQRKYQKMIRRGVNRNVAVTAVARELACFVWGMETGHIEYRQNS